MITFGRKDLTTLSSGRRHSAKPSWKDVLAVSDIPAIGEILVTASAIRPSSHARRLAQAGNVHHDGLVRMIMHGTTTVLLT